MRLTLFIISRPGNTNEWSPLPHDYALVINIPGAALDLTKKFFDEKIAPSNPGIKHL